MSNGRAAGRGQLVVDVPPRPERFKLDACPICRSKALYYAFALRDYRIVRCSACTLLMLNPQPSESELEDIYQTGYFMGRETEADRSRVDRMKRATARLYLQQLRRYTGANKGKLLEIGFGHAEFLIEALASGYDVTGLEASQAAAARAQGILQGQGRIVCGEISSIADEAGSFDVCVLADVVEHVRDPVEFLRNVRRLLKPSGVVQIATPSLDSWSARLMKQGWMEFKPEHLYYFDTTTIQHALFHAGFHEILVMPGRKVLNLDYVGQHFARFAVKGWTPFVRRTLRLVPASIREKDIPLVASGMIVLARAARVAPQHRLSVIVPAFNEVATFDTLMQALTRREVPGLDIDIIVVESNSTDGTRERALAWQHHPRVRLILEDQPRGKGYAVRQGLRVATGDFVLIQDADLEYDLEDYDVLLEPLIAGRQAFVLGARHGGKRWWKMRRFAPQGILSLQKLLALAVNCAHWFFTTVINILYGLLLKDPQTMFKVFRRDCLYGLTFTCNRFNFDYELLIKLVRKGYRPLEIPVNYRSRSYKEGKKINLVVDPIYGLGTLIWLRFTRLDLMRNSERQADTGAPPIS